MQRDGPGGDEALRAAVLTRFSIRPTTELRHYVRWWVGSWLVAGEAAHGAAGIKRRRRAVQAFIATAHRHRRCSA